MAGLHQGHFLDENDDFRPSLKLTEFVLVTQKMLALAKKPFANALRIPVPNGHDFYVSTFKKATFFYIICAKVVYILGVIFAWDRTPANPGGGGNSPKVTSITGQLTKILKNIRDNGSGFSSNLNETGRLAIVGTLVQLLDGSFIADVLASSSGVRFNPAFGPEIIHKVGVYNSQSSGVETSPRAVAHLGATSLGKPGLVGMSIPVFSKGFGASGHLVSIGLSSRRDHNGGLSSFTDTKGSYLSDRKDTQGLELFRVRMGIATTFNVTRTYESFAALKMNRSVSSCSQKKGTVGFHLATDKKPGNTGITFKVGKILVETYLA